MHPQKDGVKLQLALDMTSLRRALEICHEVESFIDIFEVGTPLIKSEGVRSISELRNIFPNKIIVADMKTIDTGELDSRISFESGADGVIFQASAPPPTVRAVVAAARASSKFCMIDSLGIDDMVKFERIVEYSGADYAVVHTGIDEQKTGLKPFDRLKRLQDSKKLPAIAIAGGISSTSLPEILTILKQGIVIVGAAITKASDPAGEAARIRLQVPTAHS